MYGGNERARTGVAVDSVIASNGGVADLNIRRSYVCNEDWRG
jgi:hypothetical protein